MGNTNSARTTTYYIPDDPSDLESLVLYYLEQCDTVLKTKNHTQAKQLRKSIIDTYNMYINNIDLNAQTANFHANEDNVYIEDVTILVEALKLLLANGCHPVELKSKSIDKSTHLTDVSYQPVDESTQSSYNDSPIVDLTSSFRYTKVAIKDSNSISNIEKIEVQQKILELETLYNSDFSSEEKREALEVYRSWFESMNIAVGNVVLPLIRTAIESVN